MFVLRYVTTFMFEALFSLYSLVVIVAKATISYLGWCHANAAYSARWQHPLWVCVLRNRFSAYMQVATPVNSDQDSDQDVEQEPLGGEYRDVGTVISCT